jgi:hypothetical protein
MKFNQLAHDYTANLLQGWYLNLDLLDTKAYIFFAVAFGFLAQGGARRSILNSDSREWLRLCSLIKVSGAVMEVWEGSHKPGEYGVSGGIYWCYLFSLPVLYDNNNKLIPLWEVDSIGPFYVVFMMLSVTPLTN